MLPKAYHFASIVHRDQRRKYTNYPYVNHCIAVAGLVALVTKIDEVIAAAVLHDTLEDTPTTYRELELMFGSRIADLVLQVTDVSKPEDGNRTARKTKDRDHLAEASPEAKTIKLADLIDNTSSILAYDPEFAKVYMEEKRQLLFVLKEGNGILYQHAKSIVEAYFEAAKI